MACNFAILEISDGTKTIDLLNARSGFHIYSWTPNLPEPKEGGVWTSSPVASGRRLAMRYYDNVTDTFTLQVRSFDVDALIRETQELRRLLEKAVAYFTSNWTSEPVWIKAQGRGEAEARYAVIYDYRTPRDGDPYDEPFWSKMQMAGFEDFQLVLEHGFWQADEPGDTTCVQLEGKGASVASQLFYPAASADDCYVDQTGAAITLNAANLYFGNVGGRSYDTGIRFRNVTIPGNVTILGARLIFTAFPAVVDSCKVTIQGQRSIAPAAFTTVVDFNARTRTAASIGWTVDQTPAGTVFASPSITAIVDEINAMIGWTSGTDMVIFISDNGSDAGANRSPVAWDNLAPAEYPILEIFYGTTDVGRDATCAREVYVANKHNRAQLTDIYYYDASATTFSANLVNAATPFSFLPAVPAVGDAVYFGVDTGVADSGPFNSLVFDISVAQADCTIVWEYYNGAFSAFTPAQDNTATAQSFDTAGVNSVHWVQETDWVTIAVNGVTGYWVRARVSAIGGAPTPPTQANRDIYTVIWPYLTVDAAQVVGDIAALARHLIYPKSGNKNLATSGIMRVLIGSRSVSRGDNFTAYLNTVDEQNIAGVTCVVAGVNTSFIADLNSPTGRALEWIPAGITAMGARATITIDSSIASEWKGTFHAFLRVGQFNGNSNDFSVRIVCNFGGNAQTTQAVLVPWSVVPPLGVYNGVVDIGTITTQDAGSAADGYGDCTITIEAAISNGAGLIYLYIYDLILIPVDEFSVDNRYNPSVLPYPALNGFTYLDVDSATVPKVAVRSIIRYASDDLMVGNWTPITPNDISLQANAEQRLWFMSTSFDSPGEFALPHNVFAVQSFATARYLSMRGNR